MLSSIALIAMLSSASAQTATGTGTANSSSNSGAVAISGGGHGGQGGAGGSATSSSNSSATGGNSRATGGNSSIIFNTPGQQSINSTTRIRQSGSLDTTPNAIAPGLGSAAIETCYGPGVSGGLAVTGFGASFGAGQYDSACNRRLNARTLYAMGLKNVALRIMAQDPEIQQAMAAEGIIRLQPGDAAYRGPVGYAQPAAYVSPVSGGPRQRQIPVAPCTKWLNGVVGGRCIVQ